MTIAIPVASASKLSGLSPLRVVCLALTIHVLLWILVPYSVVGNLFTDTAEMVYWGLDPHWAYPKHPPLPSVLTALLIKGLGHPFLLLICLGQVCFLITATYVWMALTRFADNKAALLGVVLLLASPSATIYALQVNHNTMLMPLVAGLVYHALCFVQEGRWRHALMVGLLAGLGMLTKYALAAALLPLIVTAVAIPAFRKQVISAKTLAALGLAGLIVAPHIAALLDGQTGSLSRATVGSPIRNLTGAFDSLGNLVVALALVLLIPAIAVKYWLRTDYAAPWRSMSDPERLARAGAFGPLLIMVLGAAATGQKVKPQWALAFMPAICIWLGMAVSRAASTHGRLQLDLNQLYSAARSAVLLSMAGLLGFVMYLGAGSVLGVPRWAWMADAAALEQQIEAIWPVERGELNAVLIDQRGVTGFAGLLHPDLPHIVEIYPVLSAWTDKAKLARTGGVAILSTAIDLRQPIGGLCAVDIRSFDMPSRWGHATYPVRLAVMEPSNASSGACPEPISSSTR